MHLTKHLMRLRPLLFVAALCLLVNCQDDNDFAGGNENSTHTQEITESPIGLEELQAKKPGAYQALRRFIKGKSGSAKKLVRNDSLGFTVDTDEGLLIQKGAYHSITYPIYYDVPKHGLDNLVLSLQQDSTYTAGIVAYNITGAEQRVIEAGDYVELKDKISYTGIDLHDFDGPLIKSIIECYDEITIGVQSCASGDHGAANWHQCALTGNQRPHFYISIRKICEETEGGDSGTGPGPGSPGSTGGGTGPTPGNPTPINTENPGGPQDPKKDFGAVITRPVLAINNKVLLFAQDLSQEQREFWEDEHNEEAVDLIKSIFTNDGYTPDTIAFAKWAIDYFMANPSTTPEVFENQFMGESEGIESTILYDGSYWQNTNLNIPPQTLPNKASFLNAFPPKTKNAQQICSEIGGEILTLYNDIIAAGKNMNTCAVRLSKAINYAYSIDSNGNHVNITIPAIPGKTKLGGDEKYYFTFAADMNTWMMMTFGISSNTNGLFPLNENHLYFTSEDGGTNGEGYGLLLNGSTGIYCMLPTDPITFGATGHCDGLIDGNCISKCYFPYANHVHVWVLE